MAAEDPPAGLMDIASTLSQDEIPFKLRCAICNKLAVNAFRLPCCDQSICESCQTSLPDTCSVCAHTPLSPDLCKPNKALRTTLKAFLRTEEKKREKERQSAAPVTPVITTPAENDATPTEPVPEQKQPVEASIEIPETAAPVESKDVESKDVEATNEAPVVDAVVDTDAPEPPALATESETNGHAEPEGDQAPDASTAPATDADAQPTTNGDEPAGDESASKDPSEQSDANMMNANPAGFPGIGGWNGNINFNGMNPYMANSMFNFPNGMGMPMAMDQMAANQGMYGMNMTGMGMNMGMNFNGQGMYGSSGWDGSQQNMWQAGQDKFNPNAFANGTGPPYGGGAFGGSNMSYPSNTDYQAGYYGPGYGRGGGYRGRGRGYYHGGPGRGGYGGSGQGHFSPTGNSGLPNGQPAPGGGLAGTDGTAGNSQDPSRMNENAGTDPVSNGNAQTADGTAEADNEGQQLQGIPTIDSLDQASGSMEPNGYQNHMGPGYGRGGYMRGPMPGGRGGGYWGGMPNSYLPQMPPQNPGVEGAPAAPRAMRQGLPNTSVLRQRGFHAHGKASVSSNTPTHSQRGNSEIPQDAMRTRSPSKAPSQAQGPGSRSRSQSQGRASRARSPDENRVNQRETDSQRPDTMRQPQFANRRSRSPSRMSSRRSSRRRDRDEDRERKSGHRSHRSRRQHSRGGSRSRSLTRNGDSRHPDRLKQVAEEKEPNGHSKISSDTGDRGDLASRISNGHRSGRDGHSRREEDRERDRDRDRDRDRARDSRHRDKDREQNLRDRDRDSERDRRQNRDRERERDRERGRGGERERERDRGRDRGADRERERKRRRDRSESPNANANDRSSQPQARRVKTNGEEPKRDQPRAQAAKSESEKDPYTLEREARNRERLLREQQNRGSVKSSNSKSSHRRDSRQERLVGGRRINYKYEDEL